MKREEQTIQQTIVRWFAYQYPHLKGCLCSNLNNSKDARTGSINKSLGVIAGRSDLTLYANGTAYFIEVKKPKGTQSDAQKEWQATIEAHGYDYFIVYSLSDFEKLVKQIINKN